MSSRPRSTAALLLGLLLALLAGCSGLGWKSGKVPDGARAKVAILETTDVHSNVLSYDYYKLKPDDTLGYERTATLIQRARKEFTNSFLFDSGDTIQGSVLADYQALVKPVGCQQELAIYRAMDVMG
jgi:2',3'-cyclic-nucleotide 2'-phosphodiesterase/3'-nucleotidase